MSQDFWSQIESSWHETSYIEILAAGLAVAYLLLAIRQHIGCWLAALISSGLYVWVYFGAHLYMDSALNGFYAAMAVYGFWQWRRGPGGERGATLPVSRWPVARHAASLGGILALSCFTGLLLRRFTPAAWPFVDSMVTWSSVYATYLVARKVYDNWYWWLVIDSTTVVLLISRHLYVTTLLYACYLIMIFVGMRAWRRSLHARL
jgi:nicotinamide mononucleotide transporter